MKKGGERRGKESTGDGLRGEDRVHLASEKAAEHFFLILGAPIYPPPSPIRTKFSIAEDTHCPLFLAKFRVNRCSRPAGRKNGRNTMSVSMPIQLSIAP